ncbi:TRAP transporter large permease [Defluviimonas sp. SAOS-178_SWC]|uniref:TRAP transporter large permease n=1 Tax=Defluviimonas sp. SAOS-178_SWC TaxID=3121287 RepID=UPI00322190BE
MSGAEIGEFLSILMVLCTFAALLLGFPVAFTLGGIATIFAFIASCYDAFFWPLMSSLLSRIYGITTSDTLIAIPLFVFMGVMLEKSKIAQELLETMGQLFRQRPGGLGISVIVVGTMLAASTGIVGATVVTMGLISLPTMLRAGYNKSLAAGIICSSGALAQIVPPSTVLILLAHQLQGTYMEASMAKGNFAAVPVSTADLFAGAMVPGLLLAFCYIGVVWLYSQFRPETCPPVANELQESGLMLKAIKSLFLPLLLIILVLGSILGGFATASESASVGAVGAMGLAACRWRLRLSILRDVCVATLLISTMIFVILIGATYFSLVFRGLGGEELAQDSLSLVPGGLMGATLTVLAILFLLGFFLDTFEIIFITTPIFAPVLFMLGADPIVVGVTMGLTLQTAYLTPPFGFAIFYLQGTTDQLETTTIYRGVIPFILIQVPFIVLVVLVPELTTWLPGILKN